MYFSTASVFGNIRYVVACATPQQVICYRYQQGAQLACQIKKS